RKAEQAKATGAKPAKRQKAAVQKQPDTPQPGPEKSEALSQKAAVTSEPEEVSALESAADDETTAPAPPPAPESADETTEGTEAEPAGESEPEQPEADQDLPGDAPDWVRKRMARYTRQKAELERKLQETDGERQQLPREVERLKTSGA